MIFSGSPTYLARRPIVGSYNPFDTKTFGGVAVKVGYRQRLYAYIKCIKARKSGKKYGEFKISASPFIP